MRRTYRKRFKAKKETLRRKHRRQSKKRRSRKGGLGAARRAFTKRFVQGAAQTGKQIASEVSKDVAGRLTKSAIQDENEGTISDKSKRIIKRAFNVQPTKFRTPGTHTTRLDFPKTPLVLPIEAMSKNVNQLKAMR